MARSSGGPGPTSLKQKSTGPVKVATLRVNVNLDGAPITSRTSTLSAPADSVLTIGSKLDIQAVWERERLPAEFCSKFRGFSASD